MFNHYFANCNILNLQIDKQKMDQRLRARISPWELFGIALCFSMIGIFIWLITINMGYPVDFKVYMDLEATTGLYYGAWIKPFFALLKLLPFNVAYVIFDVINVLCAFYAVRVFGGTTLFVLVSFQLLSVLFYGQMSGFLAAGIALCWWGLVHKRWNLAGLGMLIAMTKYHVGVFWCLLMFWYVAITWQELLRIMIVPALIFGVTLVLYPFWPLQIISNLSTYPFIHLGITLWIYIGAWALIFWIPALLLPMSRQERFFAILSVSTFAVPYYQHIDLLALMAMPIGWLPLITQVAFLRSLWGFTAIRLTALLPGLIYCAIIFPAGYQAVNGLITTKSARWI